MNNEEIKEARKKYKVLEEKREKLIILKNKMVELQYDERVKEFVGICNKLNLLSSISIPTDEELAHEAFNDIARSSAKPCNVYVYMGETKGNSTATYDERQIYWNLDTTFYNYNYAHKKEIFRKNNTILHYFGSDYENNYNRIRNQYFLNLLYCGQDEAIQKLIQPKGVQKTLRK